AALAEIERELDNIRVALRQAADNHTSSRYEELFSTLYTLWYGRGRNSEGASWATELTRRPDLDPATRIVALGFAATTLINSSLAAAEEMAQAAVELAASTGAAPPLNAIVARSIGAMMQGKNAAA